MIDYSLCIVNFCYYYLLLFFVFSLLFFFFFFFFSSRRRHTRCSRDWSSDVCSSDLLLGERTECLRHVVDGVGKRADLALGHEHQLLVQVAARHRGNDLADAAHLVGEVGRHQVDVVGQILPGARDTRHQRLTAKLTIGADLAGDAGHLRREYPQLLDHRVDGVLELENLSLGFDRDLLGEIAIGDGGRDESDVAYLGGQVPGQRVHAVREVLPCARRSRYARLATELSLDADLPRHGGDLIREGPEGGGHVVDGVRERRDFASRLQYQPLRQVAGRDGGHDLGDAAHLAGEVGRHHVDVVREVFPCARDAGDTGLPAKPAIRADFASNARDFAGEGAQLFDHRIDGVLQFEDLAPGVDGDLLRQVAGRHRRRHGGDVAHLVGEVPGEQVDVVGQLPPRSRDARHSGLSPQRAFDADLARHGRHLIGEGAQRIGHVVDGVGQVGHFSLGFDDELLREVAGGDGGHDLGDASHLVGEIAGHDVDVVGEVPPCTRDTFDIGLAAQLALGADLLGDARHLRAERLQTVDHRVDGVLQLEDFTLRFDGDLLGQVAVGDGGGDQRDVANLVREIAGQQIDVVGQVLPGAGDSLDIGL